MRLKVTLRSKFSAQNLTIHTNLLVVSIRKSGLAGLAEHSELEFKKSQLSRLNIVHISTLTI